MALKRLNFSEETKDFIVNALTNKLHSVTTLANIYYCHPRSINRVMEERGLSAITSKAKGISDAARVKALLKKTGLTIDQLEHLVEITKITPSVREQLRTAALFRPGAQTNEAAHAAS